MRGQSMDEQVRSAEDLGRRLVGDEPDSALFTLDLAGSICSWSEHATRLTGYVGEEILGRSFSHLSVATTLESGNASALRRALAEGSLEQEELWVRANGSPFWVRVCLTALQNGSGSPDGFAVLVRSLAGPRQHEAALLVSESLFHTTLERSPVGMLVLDAQGRQLESNDAMSQMLGYAREEFSGITLAQISPEQNQESALANLALVRQDGSAKSVFTLCRRDGSPLRVSAQAVALPGERFLLAIQDLATRTQAEELWRNSGITYRSYLEDAPLAVFVASRQGQLLEFNQAAQDLLGYDPTELLALTPCDLTPEDGRAQAELLLGTLLTQGRLEGELRLQRKDGRIIWVSIHAVSISDDLLMAFCLDVTERHVSESNLLEREAQYRAAVETSGDGFWLCDLDGCILEVNDAYVQRSGYSREHLTGMRVHELEALQYPEEIQARIRTLKETGSLRFESQHRDRDGLHWPVEVTASYCPIADGRLFVFLRDITQRKLSDTLLRARLRIAEQVVDLPLDQLMQFSLDEAERLTRSSIGFFHFVNEDQEQLTLTAWSSNTLKHMCTAEGKGAHYPVSKAGVWVDCIHTRTPVIHNDYPSLPHRKGMPEGHAPVTRELTVPVIQNGRVTAVIGVGNKTSDYDQTDVRILQELASLATDLVARKQAESLLSESQARYQHIVETANEGIWSMDAEHRTTFVNPAMCRILGFSEAEMMNRTVESFFPPDELQDHGTQMQTRHNGRSAVYERRFLRKDGSICICKVAGTPLLSVDGRFTGSFGLCTDITAVRQAELALSERVQFGQSVLNSLSAHIAVLDHEGRILEVNESWRDFARQNDGDDNPMLKPGANYLEVCRRSCATTHDESACHALEGIQRVMQGVVETYEQEYPCHSPQEERWFLMRVLPMRSVNGSVVIAHENISERKKIEKVQALLARTSSGFVDEPFFHTLARFLADDLRMSYVCIDRLEGDGLNARTIAVWHDGSFEDNVRYALKDTPCGEVVSKSACCFPAGVQALFPDDLVLQDLAAESYLGITLWDHQGKPNGLIALIGRQPLANPTAAEAVLRMVAVRASAELERLEAEEALKQRELLLNTAQRISRIGGWEWDIERQSMSWTEETYHIHDFSPDDVRTLQDQLIETSASCYREEDRQTVVDAFRRCIVTGESYDMVLPFVSRTGGAKWVRTTAEAVVRDGRIVKVVGNIADITEQRHAEESYQTLFREMLDGFALHEIILDEQGRPCDYRFLAANPAFEGMTGLTAEAIIGHTAREILPGMEASWIETYGQVALSGEPTFFENYSVNLDKHFAIAAFRPAPMQFACMFTDISERKSSDAALQRRMDLLALIARTSSRFLTLGLDQLDLAIHDTLGAVGALVGVDRSYIFLLQAETGTYCNTHEWCARGVESQLAHQREIPRTATPVWNRTLGQGEVVHVVHREDLTEEAVAERAMMELRGTRSLLMLPLLWQGEQRGFVGFDTVGREREWTSEEQHVLKAMAGLVASAMERRLRESALRESSERLNQALDAAELGSWQQDLPGGEFQLDARACRHLGLSNSTYSFSEFLERVHEDDRRNVRATLAQMVTQPEKGSHSLEFRICPDNGSINWLATYARVIREGDSETGRPLKIVGMVQDITARVQADRALKRSEVRYRNLVETTFDLIWEIDAQGVYSYASPKSIEILGYHADEITGHTPFEFMEPAEAQRVRILFDGFTQRRESFSGLINVCRHRNGQRVVLESSGTPILTPEGQLLGYRGVDRDVTIRTAAERRMAMQADVSRVLAEAGEPRETAQQILETLCLAEEFNFGVLWTLDRLSERLRALAVWTAPGADDGGLADETSACSLLPDEDLAGRALSRREPIALNNDELAAVVRRSAFASAGLHGAFCVPVQHAGVAIGALEVQCRDPLSPDPARLEVLAGIGRQLGQHLTRHLAQEELKHVVASSPSVSYILRRTEKGFIPSWVSENVFQIIGYQAHETQGSWWAEHVHPEDRPRVLAAQREMADQELQMIEHRLRHRDGHYLWVRDEKRLLRDETGQVMEVVGVWSDITDRVRLEEQLRQSQKMEAVGQLAGGVAHDFNNLLTVINGYSEMLHGSLSEHDPNRALLSDIRDAGERAAALTRQLLAFSRKQVLQPRLLNLGGVVRGLERMLRRLLGEDIILTTILPPGQPSVRVDPGQIEQVVINLCVNARDAMHQGGRLVLETRVAVLTDEHCRLHPDHHPGEYVVLQVQDSGCGMSPQVLERIFEPFFTTKGLGKGTGLGLATVLGIVQQSNGFLEVTSQPDEGTMFSIYLPRAADSGGLPDDLLSPTISRGGNERILLVEDEEAVRAVALRILKSLGYEVRDFSSAAAALDFMSAGTEHIDLLLSDVVMPQLGGPALAEKLRLQDPTLRVLFMSGYTDDSMGRYGINQSDVAFLNKPFSAAELARKVRETLDLYGHANSD